MYTACRPPYIGRTGSNRVGGKEGTAAMKTTTVHRGDSLPRAPHRPADYLRNCLKSGVRFSRNAMIASTFSGPPASWRMAVSSSTRMRDSVSR